MTKPLISVIMPTYNHADFVTQSINSVLNQKGVDFEFLIADDGSTDRTRDVVAAIRDERIKFFPNEVNRGACQVTNDLIFLASGEYIALLNSDDYWLSNNKLLKQLEVMRDKPNVGACFGKARFVDKQGMMIDKSTLQFGNVFEQQNRSRGEWLRHFFERGNCLCHPTILIRKSCYEQIGCYDNRFRQLPDFDMWIRLLKRFDIHIIDEEMIAFRHLPGENASSITSTNMRRIRNELYLIMRTFYDDMPLDVFHQGFSDLLKHPEATDDLTFEIESALLYFNEKVSRTSSYVLIGLDKLHQLLGNDENKAILLSHYAIDHKYYFDLTSKYDWFINEGGKHALSDFKTKNLLKELKRRFKNTIKRLY